MEKIDTHAHVVPPGWRKYCEEHGFGKPDGMPAIPVCRKIRSSVSRLHLTDNNHAGMDTRGAYCTDG